MVRIFTKPSPILLVSNIKAVVFDFDGVVDKSLKIEHGALNEWAKKNNLPFPKFDQKFVNDYIEAYSKKRDVPAYVNLYDRWGLPCDWEKGIDNAEVWKFYRGYKEKHPAKVYPDIIEEIKKLYAAFAIPEEGGRNKRIPLGINSSNTTATIYRQLKKHNILHMFDSIITKDDNDKYAGLGNGDGIAKPSRITIEKSLQELGVRGPETIYITDTTNDLMACIPDLVKVFAVDGFEPRESLEKGVEYIGNIFHFDEIIPRKEIFNTVMLYAHNKSF